MSKNKEQQPPAPPQPVATRERRVTLSAIEVELVKAGIAENTNAKQQADSALAARLAPIRAAHNLAEGTRADFLPTKDGATIVMVVHEPKKK